MKVGDLVTLSNYGRSVSRTGWIKKDDIGIVTKIHKVFRNTYYEVNWVKSHFGWNGQYGGFLNWGHVRNLSRRDLKMVRRESR